MRAIEKRLRPHLDENVVALWLEKWLQIHAGGRPDVYFTLFRLLRTRKDLSRAVTPDTQLVIEGFPRSGNSFARRAFIMAQDQGFDKTRIAHHLHVPAQVVRAAQWQIPTLVLIRRPKDAVLSLAIRDPISVDQALRYYVSFYETAEKYRDAYVLGLFEEVTEDFGQVIKRINDKFGTTFSRFVTTKRTSANCLNAWTQTPKEVWRDAIGAQGSTPLRGQGENKTRNGIRPGEPKTKKADRPGRGCVRPLNKPDAQPSTSR
jgi:hypothetical protein